MALRSPAQAQRLKPAARKAGQAAALKMGLFDTLKKTVGLADNEMETVVFGAG